MRLFKTSINNDIQVLRGLAVLSVVLFHLSTNFQNGYLGVDIFFVISGYLILPKIIEIFPIHSSKFIARKGVEDFLRNRFWRLFPAFSITLTTASLLFIFFAPINDLRNFAKSVALSYFGLGNLAAFNFTTDYFSPNINPLTHTWSLAVEEQIYIFVPIFLYLLHRKKFGRKVFYQVLSVLGAFSLLISVDFTARFFQSLGVASWSNLNYYSTASRFWEFLLGGLTATLSNRGNRIFSRKLPPFFSNSMFWLLVVIVLFPVGLPRFEITFLICVLTGAMINFTGRKENQLIPRPLLKPLWYLGNISYSVYLVHLPVIYLFQYSPHFPKLHENTSIFIKVFILVVIILISIILHVFAETRFRLRASSSSMLAKFTILAGPISCFCAILVFMPSAQALDPNLPPNKYFKPWDWDGDCQIFSEPDRINNSSCKYGSLQSKKRVLLIGDSHAATISQHFADQARQENWNLRISTFAGCGFMNPDAVINTKFQLPYYSAKCREHNMMILELIRNFSPTLIIIGRHSSSSMILPSTFESRLYYNQLLLSAIRLLPNQNFLVIGSVPEYSPVGTLGAYLMGQKGFWNEAPFQDSNYWNTLDVHNLKYFDTLSLFCPGKKCQTKNNKGYYFVDNSHLSSFGGGVLFNELRNAGYLSIEP